MCGICGWVFYSRHSYEEDGLLAMKNAIAHRGPDDTGSYFSNGASVALGQNRLSIIDLSQQGHQPMINSENGDVLIFNGEIYNYKKVRLELEKLGYQFSSESDTEVILYSYAQWGNSCLQKLAGMYSIAIWSEQKQSLFMARDPMGIKPLYYSFMPEKKGIVFASEVKAILTLPDFSRSIDRDSLSQFLEFGYTFDQENTIFRDIKKIPPGYLMTITKDLSVKPKRFYYPELNATDKWTRDELEQNLYSVLKDVVKEQLVSDVPLGLLLSGGLDSSILAAIAAQMGEVRTFSFGFSESDIDERDKALLVSKHIGSNHESFQISPNEIIGGLDKSIRHMDDLFADWGVFSTRIMYEKCRERGVKVVLVGEGADELFGGYWGRFKPSMDGDESWTIDWRLFQMYRVYIGRRYGKEFLAFRKIMKQYLKQTKGNLFNAIRLFESREQLSNNFVMKVDKASMAESVEARVPYLDSRVADVAYQISGDYLIGGHFKTKSILSSMARRYDLLPDTIIDQGKFGIGLPPEWMDASDSFKSYAREIILDTNGWAGHLGLSRAMDDFFNKDKQGFRFPSGISIFRNLAWKLLLLDLWSRYYEIDPSSS